MKKLALLFLIGILFCIVCCNETTSTKTANEMQQEVLLMMNAVSKDIAANGPGKWMNYFEDTTVFFMASDGRLVFPNYNAAKKFITDTLAHAITKVDLTWQKTHIDSISENTVAINSFYHEDLTASNNSIIHADGYCTAIADYTNAGWKFRNLHWSSVK